MIGYYIHHQGLGHLHRACAFAAAWSELHDEEVAGLSSLTRPLGWEGPWVRLHRDDNELGARDVSSNGQLHWAPLGADGLRHRMAEIAAWIERAAPQALVVDVSVEVALLARLHGIPIVTVLQPGRRIDPAHLLGFRISDALVACWPIDSHIECLDALTPGLPIDVRNRVVPVGGISRLPVRQGEWTTRTGERRGVVLRGFGGEAGEPDIEHPLPSGWTWTVLGGVGRRAEDPSPFLADADVVVTSAGQGSLADIAAMRRPAVVVPEPRPHDEQLLTARMLATSDWPVVVAADLEEALDPAVLDRAAALDVDRWRRWVDGNGATRFAAVVRQVVLDQRPVAWEPAPERTR